MPRVPLTPRRSAAVGLAAAFLALAACGSDNSGSSSATTTATTAAGGAATTAAGGATTTAAGGASTSAAPAASGEPGAFAKANYTTPLAADCPATIVVQKDWLAEAEHAAMYQLIGGGGKMEQNKYTGPLGSTGVQLQILDGGPGLGDGITTVSSLFAGNLVQGITPMLAFVGTDDAVQFSKQFPVTAVVTPLDKQPTMLMYDPNTYKDIKTVQDVIATNADIYVTTKTQSYVQFLIGQGVPEDKFIEGYAGDKEKFVTSGGKLINQGYVSNEVYSYEHETDTWDKPVAYVLVNDLGYQPYPSALSVRTDKLAEYSNCLKKLVPLMQQAQVDYMKDPAEVNKLLTEYNPTYSAPFWFTSAGLNDAAVQIMKDRKIVTDGPSGIGSFDEARMQKLIDILIPIFKDQGIDSYKDGVTPADVTTNQFIDPSIKLGT